MSVTVVLRMVLESYNDVLSDEKITFKFDGINLIGDFFGENIDFEKNSVILSSLPSGVKMSN